MRSGPWAPAGARHRDSEPTTRLRVVYDLACSSPTWDFLVALALMESERRRLGHEGIDLLIAPGPNHGFREEPFPPNEPVLRERMLQEVVLPLATLVPNVRVERLQSREGLAGLMGFEEPLIGLGSHLHVLKSPDGRCLDFEAEPEPGLITMTLRECAYMEDRNSDLASWLEAAHRLRAMGRRVVFVRDTSRADEPLEDFEIAPLASRDVLARANLYGRAEVNAFVVNGPFVLAQLGNLPAVAFWKSGGGHYATSREYYEANGMRWGSQYPMSPPWQRLAWRGDGDPDAIVAEIESIRKADRAWEPPKGSVRL